MLRHEEKIKKSKKLQNPQKPQKTQKPQKSARLSCDVVPMEYEITLEPDIAGGTFTGLEKIHLNLLESTKQITLHSLDLEVIKAEVSNQDQVVQKITYDQERQTVTLHFANKIDACAIALEISFKGKLSNNMCGFYRSSYKHQDKDCFLATTQFESTDARRAFPCFDEPAAKAIFNISLIVPEDMTAVSNTSPVSNKKIPVAKRIIKFAPTPVMSTYLLAFIVGNFEYLQQKTKEGVIVRVYVTPGKKKQAIFALDCAVKFLSFYNEYFDIPYPLQTLDLIAIPDFNAGAMENWGAITFRESAILVDSKLTSTYNKQWIAIVIAHEIAHQWFGNLVTMEWWTHLWLNEGFASYMEFVAVAEFFPEWHLWEQFVVNDHATALGLDSLKNTHAIEIEVNNPAEIGEIFDAVSYSKGSSIIRMLADYLGQDSFRDGLRHYLKEHSYKNTLTEDLWIALEHVTHKPVKKIMESWTAQKGYPLISVSGISVSGNLVNLKINQTRFFSDPRMLNKIDTQKTIWEVPLSFLQENDQGNKKINKFLLEKSSDVINLEKASTKNLQFMGSNFIKVNPGESGFYRVQYSSELLFLLKEAVSKGNLSTIDRFGLIRDTFSLVTAGRLSFLDLMALLDVYRQETEYIVLAEILGNLGRIQTLLQDSVIQTEFNTFGSDFLAPTLKRLGYTPKKDEEHLDTLLRPMVWRQAGNFGHPQALAQAQNLWQKISVQDNPTAADLCSTVYRLAAKQGNATTFQKLINLYESAELHEEKNRLGSALGHFPTEILLKRGINYIFKGPIRNQDIPTLLYSFWQSPKGRLLVYEYLLTNWDKIIKRFGLESSLLNRLISPFETFFQNEKAKEISLFFKDHPTPGCKRTIAQIIERIGARAAEHKSLLPAAKNYFKS